MRTNKAGLAIIGPTDQGALLVAELSVEQNARVALNENEFSALVAFVMSVGRPNLRKSKLLRTLNEGDYNGAAMEFCKWGREGGKARRVAEALLFTKRVET